MFGESLLVAPITEAIDNTTGMVEKKIWIPEVGCVCFILKAVLNCMRFAVFHQKFCSVGQVKVDFILLQEQ